MRFARTLTALRRKAGLSQEQLALQMEVSRQAVGKWEAGQSMPELDKLVALSDLFGVSLDELVRGIKPQPEQRADFVAQQPHLNAGANTAPVLVLPGYEYKSSRSWHGLPLVHINFGYGRYGLRRAKGVIAIGNVATGIVALGAFSVGLVSFGGIGLGLLSLGGLALGWVALGGLAAGWLAIGGCAVGVYALGAAAVAAKAAVGTSALSPGASAGLNPDAAFVITAKTRIAEVAAYLQSACPDLPGPLRYLLSRWAL